MTTLRAAAQQALEAWDDPLGMKALCEAMDSLRAALAEPVQEPYTGDVTRIIREAGMTFHLGLPHKPVIEQMSRVVDLVYAEASIKAAQQFAAPPQRLPLTDEECDAVMLALDGWARGVDHYEYGLPIHNEELRETARAVIRATHGIGSKT